MSLKIGIIGTRGIPNNYGGFEQFAEYLSEGLVKKGCSVSVYNSHNHPYKETEWKGVNIIKKFDPEYLFGLSGQFIYDLNCITDSRKRKFDVILQLGYTTNSIWHFFLRKKPLKICNPDGMEWKRSKYPGFVKSFLKYAEKLAVKSNDALIADSRVIQSYYQTKYKKKTYYSAYPAQVFKDPNTDLIEPYGVKPFKYNLLIARFQIDNNIEEVIKGTINSTNNDPLILIGNYNNKFGKYLIKKYNDQRLKFLGPIYDIHVLNNLRYYSNIYFHGHSAGGTNPSLLEAMACSTFIIAHDNPYNNDVLKENAFYFADSENIVKYLNDNLKKEDFKEFSNNNIKSINESYNISKIIDEYYSVIQTELKENKL